MHLKPQPSQKTKIPCRCEKDPTACLKHMFVDQVQYGRIQSGQNPARRPVFPRLHGVAHGRFEVAADLPKKYRVGIFAKSGSFPAWLRFSSDIPDGVPDLKSTVGIGIKLFGVEGEKLLAPDTGAPTMDFLLQNINVFFVDNAEEMCSFTKASLTSAEEADAWLKKHPRTAEILEEMKKVVPSVLSSDYWSVIPFRFGEKQYCKYKIVPETREEEKEPDYDDPTYLAADLEKRLAAGEVRFKFMVQLRTKPKQMPLDQLTQAWDEALSEPVQVGTIIIPKQDIGNRGQAAYGEGLAFNPWHTLKAHQPVGSIAEARKVVYQASADLRRNVNGQTISEPLEPRPVSDYPPAKDTEVVYAAIHPAIGVARLGDSREEDGWFIGPEVTDPPPTPAGGNRDRSGAIKRQAAQFRIYGYNAAGEVVGEIDMNQADIKWKVHLANKKSEWFQFQYALDLPEAHDASFIRRNADIKGVNRKSLIVDPGPRTIEAANTSGPDYQFDNGTFMGVPVPLGEIRTDEAGRLIVLGGHGDSASPEGKPPYDPADPSSFNNANDWFDDTSDGPVTAEVTIDGRAIPVKPAWVIAAPPNYAPDTIAWRTMYDLMTDVFVANGMLPYPEQVSFSRDIQPVLQRLSNLQWVNKGFAVMFGKGTPMDFEDPNFVRKLAQKPSETLGDPYQELRQVIYNAFRPANNDVNDPRTWPWIYGDAFGSFDDSPANNLDLSDLRGNLMLRWVHGDFIDDYDPANRPPRHLDDVPVAEQPHMLDKAAMHFCLADAFHPGCEMTWPMRHPTMYAEPYRLRHREAGGEEPNLGSSLTQEKVLMPGGPLYAQSPGDVTRWMAMPWQGDTAFCRSGYDLDYDPYVPTFWPARVPNQVLTEEDYNIVVDTSLPREERIAAYNNRENWLRFLKGNTVQQMDQMVKRFGQMGIVEMRPGVKDDPDFPAVMFVETLPISAKPVQSPLLKQALKAGKAALARGIKSRLEKAGWESREQLEEFNRVRRRK